MTDRFYNAHSHCFTYDHVPEYFISRWIAVSWLLSRKWLKKLIKNAPVTGRFGFIGDLLIFVFRVLFGLKKIIVIRFINFIKYGDRKSQEEIIKSIRQYYPEHTGYVFLSMDMEYMGAGVPPVRFGDQLAELEKLKLDPALEHIIYPFIFCDPRRIGPEHPREVAVKTDFSGDVFLNCLKDKIGKKIFQGIKLYPALGYHMFDRRMKPVYDFALENGIPFIVHCSVGAVHFKYRLDEPERYHPILKRQLPDVKAHRFQEYFTHPLNYECLLNRELLKTYWGPDAPDYSRLKICLGHWGTEKEWIRFIEDAWADVPDRKMHSRFPSLELDNWFTDKNKVHNFSWFSIICDLIRKYDHIYADISYSLADTRLLPLLKMILEADEKIRSRVLFGTDFYMVSKSVSEREFVINVRAFLGTSLFNQIAIANTEEFLGNRFVKPENKFWEEKQ